MGYMIMAYAAEGYQEFILPELMDSDFEIILEKQIFGIVENIPVRMENIDGKWSFCRGKDYRIRLETGEDGCGLPLRDGLVFRFFGLHQLSITLVILASAVSIPSFAKYKLCDIRQITIGKDEQNTVEYDFGGFISRSHAVLFRYGHQWVLQDNSSNGTYLNGRRVREQVKLDFGDQITLFGLRMVFLGDYLAAGAWSGEYRIHDSLLTEWHPGNGIQLQEQEAKEIRSVRRYFKRSPRVTEELYTETIDIEAPPVLNLSKKRPLLLTIGPSFTMAIPMLLGCLMAILSAQSRGGSTGAYMFTGVITAVSSAVIGVIWALTNLRYSAREEEEAEEQRYNTYGQYLIKITEFIKEKYDANSKSMFRKYLSGQECCSFSEEDPRLWAHNERQKDFMEIRLGLGTVPFQAPIQTPKEKITLYKDDLAEKPAMIRENYRYLYSVPVCMDIRNKGLIGIVGGEYKRGAYPVVRNMIAQLAANNCYTEVKLGFIYKGSSDTKRQWEFAKWLPHVWTEGRKSRMIASNKQEVGDFFYEMSHILRTRTEENQEKKEYPLPHLVLFIDDVELIEGELLENYMYDPKPEYGITVVFLTQRYEELPNSCEYVIQNDGTGMQTFHVFNEEERSRDLVLETLEKEPLEALARRLSRIEVKESEGTGEIPGAVNFFEMYGVRSLEQLHIMERWKKNRNYETMRVPIGLKSGGVVCHLDIHEKYHGPHGLVAGTTGSGKSETLQTYILSLAVNFSPDDIAFFIIDFKGGGMANLFTGLPHLAGAISNLSGNQVRRAMISIKSENRRRQRVFAQHGVNNINAYTRLYKGREVELPIPHLFIIIDEFAELKREEPEFMKELISVAQVGRSLGVHLILATQKPSGTVDDNIWSNSKFRLCLRVQDKQDSNDMLHKPDAAYITQAGRGYLQVGNDEIYEQFQSGYSGAEYIDDPEENREAAAVMLTLSGKQIYAAGSRVHRQRDGGKERNQLEAVSDYLRETAERLGYAYRLQLWLPVLPERLFLSDLKEAPENVGSERYWDEKRGAWNLEATIGLYDDPENQAQKPLTVNFSENGHLAVFGTAAVGKSTLLQTMLYGILKQYSPAELNCYILDYSSRLLLPFEQAPHCGGVIIDTDGDKVQKFFYMMTRIMDERKELLRGGNYSQYLQAHRNDRNNNLPAILVIIDNYAGFSEKTNGRFADVMLRLGREGAGYGIYLATAAAGIGVSEIPTRLADNMKTILALEMGDKFKYGELLHTSHIDIMPESEVKGRGLAYVHGDILEFQTAIALQADDAYQLGEQIQQNCRLMAEAWQGPAVRSIPVIPEHPQLKDIREMEEYQRALEDARYLPLGYAAMDASVYSVDLCHTYCYMIQGKNRTGKKNVMKLLLYAAARKEHADTVLIDVSGQEFKAVSDQLNVKYVEQEQDIYDFFKETIPLFKERNQKKRELTAQGMEEEEVAAVMSREKQIFIFVTDLTAFIRAVYKPQEGVGSISAYLENITEKGSCHGFYFFGLLNPEQANQVSGYTLYVNMTAYKTGIHLGGNLSSQRLFQFSNIPFQEQSKVMKPGRGFVPAAEDAGLAETVVLPLAKGGFL